MNADRQNSQRRDHLVAEIESINRKRRALDEALRRRQLALARLDASETVTVPRLGPAHHAHS